VSAGPGWYLRRLRAMSPAEIGRRLRDESIKQALRVAGKRVRERPLAGSWAPPPALPAGAAEAADPHAREAVVQAAEGILRGEWMALGVRRTDLMPEPDWFLDPETGRRAPDRQFSFDVNPRDPGAVGNVKNTWELSRLHHVTVLAAAYFLTGREEFAATADRHLRSWWRRNEFLGGLHWRSGIELGVRLISWTWARRLLEGWKGAPALFERNPEFRRGLYQHLFLLARLPSHGSSANNHLIAEAAGGFVACCAFPWFVESAAWRATFAATLEREAAGQTFPSGLNRELATGYQGFVLELLLAANFEGEVGGHPLGSTVHRTIVSMVDAIAAMADVGLGLPCQGDGDEGTALLTAPDVHGRWGSLLVSGERLFGRCPWWPDLPPPDVRAALWSSTGAWTRDVDDRPEARPSDFGEAGMVILRDLSSGSDEIWCRCDSGPHGFLSLAAHAHADALSIEVRHGGVEILADPGTYCYHSEPVWRHYFRSTAAHNTLQLDGEEQSVPSGPFGWAGRADGRTIHVSGLDAGGLAEWQGAHNGYARLRPPAEHRRRVRLDREARSLTIEDEVIGEGVHACRLAFHLGPQVECRLEGSAAFLEWCTAGGPRGALLQLPPSLRWEAIRGRFDPPGGWYSPSFGIRVPATTLVGAGEVGDCSYLTTVVDFKAAEPGQRRPTTVRVGEATGGLG
jgi:hypothetical protein